MAVAIQDKEYGVQIFPLNPPNGHGKKKALMAQSCLIDFSFICLTTHVKYLQLSCIMQIYVNEYTSFLEGVLKGASCFAYWTQNSFSKLEQLSWFFSFFLPAYIRSRLTKDSCNSSCSCWDQVFMKFQHPKKFITIQRILHKIVLH